jgi:hypothetical protein
MYVTWSQHNADYEKAVIVQPGVQPVIDMTSASEKRQKLCRS